MAFGSAELDLVASTTDLWVEANALDLYSTQNVLMAVLRGTSKEINGSLNFRQASVDGGGQWKIPVYGLGNSSVAGVTRANQVNAVGYTVPTNLVTNVLYPWTHYQGVIDYNYEDMVKNSGSSQRIDLARVLVDQITRTFANQLGNDLWANGTAGSITAVQSVIGCLQNTGTVAGIDQTDTVNNSWFRSNTNSDVEVFNTQMFSALRDAATHDTGFSTEGMRGIEPDIAFLSGDLYSKLRMDLQASQRVEVSDTLSGGAKYLMFDGMKIGRETRMPAGTVVLLNSSVCHYRYHTESPEPNAPGWLVVPDRPALKRRGYNWMVGFGIASPKHCAYASNKSAS